MNTELPKPFSIEEIQKYPKAVVIALLIGLLLLFGSVITFLFIRKEDADTKCETEKKELYDIIIKERNDRIDLYENLIFYKNKSEELETEIQVKDSIVRDKTETIVKKILQK